MMPQMIPQPIQSDAPSNASADVSPDDIPDTPDTSSEVEIAVLRERVRNLEELANYHRELLKDSEWRYQQAVDQLGTSQRTVETITKALPNADTAKQSHFPPVLVALRKEVALGDLVILSEIQRANSIQPHITELYPQGLQVGMIPDRTLQHPAYCVGQSQATGRPSLTAH